MLQTVSTAEGGVLATARSHILSVVTNECSNGLLSSSPLVSAASRLLVLGAKSRVTKLQIFSVLD